MFSLRILEEVSEGFSKHISKWNLEEICVGIHREIYTIIYGNFSIETLKNIRKLCEKLSKNKIWRIIQRNYKTKTSKGDFLKKLSGKYEKESPEKILDVCMRKIRKESLVSSLRQSLMEFLLQLLE